MMDFEPKISLLIVVEVRIVFHALGGGMPREPQRMYIFTERSGTLGLRSRDDDDDVVVVKYSGMLPEKQQQPSSWGLHSCKNAC